MYDFVHGNNFVPLTIMYYYMKMINKNKKKSKKKGFCQMQIFQIIPLTFQCY